MAAGHKLLLLIRDPLLDMTVTNPLSKQTTLMLVVANYLTRGAWPGPWRMRCLSYSSECLIGTFGKYSVLLTRRVMTVCGDCWDL